MTLNKANYIAIGFFFLFFMKRLLTMTNWFKSPFLNSYLMHSLFIGLGAYALAWFVLYFFFVKKKAQP